MKKDPWSQNKGLCNAQAVVKVSKPKRRWRLLPILWMALKRTCTLLGAVMLITIIMTMWAIGPYVQELEQSLPHKMVLHLKLDGTLGDLPKEASFTDPFSEDTRTVRNYITALERAKDDPRVAGIYAEMRSPAYSLAHIQELRAALADFRSSGKFAYVYGMSYSGGLGQYYLARGFDEVWLQPMGVVALNGLNAEMPFLRDVLDNVGVEPNMFQRKEYKSAYESLTRSEISKANQDSTRALIDDIAGIITSDLEQDMDVDFKSLVDRGLFLDQEAFQADLVDHVKYVDELFSAINQKVTGDPEDESFGYVAFDAYVLEPFKQSAFAAPKVDSPKPNVALIYAVGAIMDDDKKGNSADDGIASADDVADALYDAARDDAVKAVVLRVNSPGGSPVASETILRAMEKVQDEGKTVTVSMGPVAASGGYWISAYADQIFVLPSTITGSIGVLGGKFSLAQMWEKLDVNWSRTAWGENAGMWSMNTPFSESEAKRMNAMLDHIYDGFVARVAQGRGMDVTEVEALARGRVWSGKRAVENGLADQFGGLSEALDYAAAQVDTGYTRADIDVVVMPRPLSAVERFVALLEGQVMAGRSLGALAGYLEPLEPMIAQFMVMQDARSNSVYAPITVQ